MTAINEQNVMGTVFNPSLYRIESMELDTIKNGANTGSCTRLVRLGSSERTTSHYLPVRH